MSRSANDLTCVDDPRVRPHGRAPLGKVWHTWDGWIDSTEPVPPPGGAEQRAGTRRRSSAAEAGVESVVEAIKTLMRSRHMIGGGGGKDEQNGEQLCFCVAWIQEAVWQPRAEWGEREEKES